MISSETGGQVTAGIALTRNYEMPFTVAYHAWESEAVHKAVDETGQDIKELATGGTLNGQIILSAALGRAILNLPGQQYDATGSGGAGTKSNGPMG